MQSLQQGQQNIHEYISRNLCYSYANSPIIEEIQDSSITEKVSFDDLSISDDQSNKDIINLDISESSAVNEDSMSRANQDDYEGESNDLSKKRKYKHFPLDLKTKAVNLIRVI